MTSTAHPAAHPAPARPERHLKPVSDTREHVDEHERYVATSLSDALDQRGVFLGRVIELETELLARDYRPGGMSERERAYVAGELRDSWSAIGAGCGDPTKWVELRALGLGEGTST